MAPSAQHNIRTNDALGALSSSTMDLPCVLGGAPRHPSLPTEMIQQPRRSGKQLCSRLSESQIALCRYLLARQLTIRFLTHIATQLRLLASSLYSDCNYFHNGQLIMQNRASERAKNQKAQQSKRDDCRTQHVSQTRIQRRLHCQPGLVIVSTRRAIVLSRPMAVTQGEHETLR